MTSRPTPPRPPLITRRTWAWAAAVFVLTFAATAGALVLLLPPARNGGSFSSLSSVVSAVTEVASSPDLVFGSRDFLTIVVIGRDVDRDRRGQVMKTYGRSDTIMVAYFDRRQPQVHLLSIPRDTLMRVRGSVCKINAAHSFGGPELLIDALKSNLCLQVHHWIRVNFEGSVKIIDAMGGVWVDVEKDMKYDDNWGNLHINLKKGYQKLDGAKAHQYLRFRKDREGDIGRIRRQQKLMRAVARQLLQPNKLLKLPRIMKAMQEVVDTDLTDAQLMSLAAYLRKVPAEAITTDTLPSHSRGAHWVMATHEAGEVLTQRMGLAFNPVDWRRRGAGRYAAMPLPAAPVKDPPPTELTEQETLIQVEGPAAPLAVEVQPAAAETGDNGIETPPAIVPPPVPVEGAEGSEGAPRLPHPASPPVQPKATPAEVAPIGGSPPVEDAPTTHRAGSQGRPGTGSGTGKSTPPPTTPAAPSPPAAGASSERPKATPPGAHLSRPTPPRTATPTGPATTPEKPPAASGHKQRPGQ